MTTVDIAMASYNGEQYIGQQIDSILAQTFTNWRLLIRDDGSSDRTVDIIRQYCCQDARIVLLEDSAGNLGTSMNFERIISHCTAQYTMLADQDDVWFEDKISRSLQLIMQHDQEIPLLLFSNSILTNSDISHTLGYLYSKKLKCQLKDFLFANAGYQGASMMFNRALQNKIFPFMPNSNVHDYHICLIAFFYGKIIFLDKPLLSYRRHETAINPNNKSLVARIKSFFQGEAILCHPVMKQYLIQLWEYHKDNIGESEKKTIEIYLKIIDGRISRLNKIILARKGKFTLRNSQVYLLLKIILVRW